MYGIISLVMSSRMYDVAESKRSKENIELGRITSIVRDGNASSLHEGAGDIGIIDSVDPSSPSRDESSQPPENAFEDSRPTRRYQTMLLISGFLMIFQVIGINSIYGVFQVSANHSD